jgi:hypothetical protein
VTRTLLQIARQQQAREINKKKSRFRTFVLKPLAWLVGVPAATIVSYSLLAWIWPAPKSTVYVQAERREDCLIYGINFVSAGELDEANFTINFPHKLLDIKLGVPQNASPKPDEHYLQMFVSDLDTANGNCRFASNANTPLDETSVTAKVLGNTAVVHITRPPTRLGVMGTILASPFESTMIPAPQRLFFEGRFTYTLFGMPVRKNLRFDDHGGQIVQIKD